MLRKFNLVPALFAISTVLVIASSTMAACIFRLEGGGPVLTCSTCHCDKMKEDGVHLSQCVDLMVTPNSPRNGFDKIVRYSDTDVRLHSAGGTESPLASDAFQKQFDDMAKQPNLKENANRLRPTAGVISQERCAALARQLGVEIVEGHSNGPGRVDPIKRPNN